MLRATIEKLNAGESKNNIYPLRRGAGEAAGMKKSGLSGEPRKFIIGVPL